MRRTTRLRSTFIALTTLGLMVAMPHSFAAVTGQWFFGEVVIPSGQTTLGNVIPAGQQFQSGVLPVIHAADAAAGGTTIRAANLDSAHPKSVYLPGWTAADSAGNIPAAASMLSSDPGFEALGGTTNGVDGGVAFDPETSASFSVTAWIKPDDPALVPAAVGAGTSVSPNIAQKGTRQTAATSHFWKMSLAMTTNTAGQKRWFAFCEFKGATVAAPSVEKTAKPGYLSAAGRLLLEPGTAYKMECIKTATSATVAVTPSGGTRVFKTETLAAPINVSNDRPLSVGKKPGSLFGNDSYAGIIDNLVIDKTP